IELRHKARAKFTRAGEMLFDRVALEQSTDELVAAYKATRFANLPRVVDLCCGIGGDAIALAAGRELICLDWSATRLAMTRHNVGAHGLNIIAQQGDAAFDRPEGDAVHIDPDRRVDGGRKHAIEEGSPTGEELTRIVAHYGAAAIKLSPGIPFETLP